jgi:hypothetical protein
MDGGVLLRADDGAAYLIPREALEQFRLSADGVAAVEARLAEVEAEGSDVRGHGQHVGQFSMTMPVWVPVAWGAWGYWWMDPYRIDPKSTGYPGRLA